MARPRHPNKEIEAAVRYAEARGWTLTPAKGHAWGRLRCPPTRPATAARCPSGPPRSTRKAWSDASAVGSTDARTRRRPDDHRRAEDVLVHPHPGGRERDHRRAG